MKEIENKSKLMLEVEQKYNKEIEEILREMFVDKNKTTQDIADELSISYVTSFKWLLRAGIYSRRLEI